MTKVRPPLSIFQALDRIAGHIPGDWTAMAAVTGRAERTVRKWGEPDTPECISMECAIALDIEFQRCGGIGAPIHDVYALLLKTGLESAFASQAEIADATMAGARESGEAVSAQIACTLPGADHADLDRAIRETEDAITAYTRTLALLRASARPP